MSLRGIALGSVVLLTACAGSPEPPAQSTNAPAAAQPAAPASLEMGGRKSVTRFFVTSRGIGRGGDLGGLAGADAHCQALAMAEGSGDHTWRAYLSASATVSQPAVHARDRIGPGPWYNSEGELVAATLAELHGAASRISKALALTERLDVVNGVGDTPNTHDILTGSQSDGTAFPPGDDRSCANWTSSSAGRAQVGHHDRKSDPSGADSWNSAHASSGCSQDAFSRGAGAALLYCFALD